ncbi:MAG: 50S ribosomal protein L6 [Patescibacteria group bacterium]|nr:50S ribosomal protein L6 [Patescibacteria group bacterium]
MSRIGKQIRKIPNGVTVEIVGDEVVVKGPKGALRQTIHPRITIAVNNGEVEFKTANENLKKDRALWGTFSALVKNMIEGVVNGYKKELEINGVGFKANMKGDVLVLDVGYSHQVEFKSPEGIKLAVDKNLISVVGIDKQLVGETAAQIRAIRKPEPYKGKGIKYIDEVIRRKAGKTAAKSAA